MLTRAVIPFHIDEPLTVIVVVKERGIEAAAVQINAVRPAAVDRFAGRQIVVHVLEAAFVALDVRVDEPEKAIGIRQTRRPDAAGVGIAAHVEQLGSIQRMRDQTPVHEVS